MIFDVEFLGITDVSHNLARHRLFRDAPNALEFSFTFRYRDRPNGRTANRPDLDCRLEITWFSTHDSRDSATQAMRSFGPSRPTISHVDFGKAKASGFITFEIDPRARFSRFVLKVGSGDPPMASLDLGTYVHPDEREEDILEELITEDKLLVLPRGWPLIEVCESYFTNIVPAGDFLFTGSDDLGTELCQRLAARAARLIPQGSQIWPWPGIVQEQDRKLLPLSLVNQRFHANTDRVATDLERIHGFEIVDDPRGVNTTILAFFHTRVFSELVRSATSRGMVVFGFSNVDANVTPVVDLRAFWREPLLSRLPAALRRKLRDTATTASFQKHRLDHLQQALLSQQRHTVADIDSDLDPDLAKHAFRARRRGFFLNSEPSFVEYWVDLKILGFGQDLLLHAAGKAIRAIIRARTEGAVLIVNMIAGLADEFELSQPALRPTDLGLKDEEADIVDVSFKQDGQPHITPSLPSSDEGTTRTAILLTPIDTYVGASDAIASTLASSGYEVIGLVPLVSAAVSRRYKPSDWHADVVPVMRFVDNKIVIHPRLQQNRDN